MLEQFKLKRCPTVIVMKIIGFLLSLAVMIAFVFVFYPMPEKYETEADVRESKAFDALVDATRKVYINELNYTYAPLVQQTFMPYKITWIYEASLNGYNIYSKIDYAVDGQSKTAYCKTYCGETWGRAGSKFAIISEIISEGSYFDQNSRFISSEQEYNDLAVSTVYWAMKAKL